MSQWRRRNSSLWAQLPGGTLPELPASSAPRRGREGEVTTTPVHLLLLLLLHWQLPALCPRQPSGPHLLPFLLGSLQPSVPPPIPCLWLSFFAATSSKASATSCLRFLLLLSQSLLVLLLSSLVRARHKHSTSPAPGRKPRKAGSAQLLAKVAVSKPGSSSFLTLAVW